MDTPTGSAMHRFVRRVVLAASLLFLACGEDGDHYAPFGNDETPRETVVAGLVRDAGKSAVSDALVVIEPATNGVPASADFLAKNPGAASASTPGRRVTTTNDHGRFAFDDVEAGDYYLQVIADDHLGGMQSVRVPDRMALVDTVYVDVNLTPTGTFSGVATLENAASHQGTVVYVQGTSYVAITDPTGAYAITNVPVGSYTIRAEHAHYLEDTENGTLTTAGENVALASMLLKLNSNISPVATIASASPLYATFPVDFVASGSDADGSVVLYEWDWEDDGTFDYSSPSTASTSHTYAATGDYTAKLRVTDDGGAIGLAAIQLTITTLPVAVYMATTGNDANDGSVASPVLTLARAYQVAQAENLDEIFIAQGTYFQVPAFLPGYTIRAGRSLPLWEESASAYSRFSYAASRATASTINTSTLIRRVELVLSAPGGPGQNSIALYASNSNSTLVFEECRFQTNNGLAGTSGLPGSVGQSGGNGSAGNPGSCDGARGLGGAGGFSPVACTGGGGGAGGVEGPNNGQTGGAGGCGGGGGGTGGQGDEGSVLSCDAVGGPGAQGSSGSAGSGGPNGSPASNTGTIAGNEWVPNTSSAGGPGGSGRGGGGGGGGGGQGGTFCDDGGGNGGGGGGGGGEGGDGGGGGQGGRASFCVMLVNSSPTFVDCMFQRAVGGAGGSGAAGRPGGSGGSGGSGATACTGEVGRGGNGGAGGAGGTGGGGAGGPGGPSFGIYRVNSFPSVVNPTYSGGAGGTGGLGGGTAFDGPAGLSGNIN